MPNVCESLYQHEVFVVGPVVKKVPIMPNIFLQNFPNKIHFPNVLHSHNHMLLLSIFQQVYQSFPLAHELHLKVNFVSARSIETINFRSCPENQVLNQTFFKVLLWNVKNMLDFWRWTDNLRREFELVCLPKSLVLVLNFHVVNLQVVLVEKLLIFFVTEELDVFFAFDLNLGHLWFFLKKTTAKVLKKQFFNPTVINLSSLLVFWRVSQNRFVGFIYLLSS